MRDGRDALLVAGRSDGELISRPVSPHLQVYRWPISMVLSISHRITGVGLSVGTILMTWWLIAAAISESAFALVQGFLGSAVGAFMLLCWIAALVLHLFQGIRQLMWDAGWGFGTLAPQEPVSLESERRIYSITGWCVIVLTVAATLIVGIAGFVGWP